VREIEVGLEKWDESVGAGCIHVKRSDETDLDEAFHLERQGGGGEEGKCE
jgi:hypothetical protein